MAPAPLRVRAVRAKWPPPPQGARRRPAGATIDPSGSGFDVQADHTYAQGGVYFILVFVSNHGSQTEITATTNISGATPWGASAVVRRNDPNRADLTAAGDATVTANTGGVRLSNALDFDLNPGNSVVGSPGAPRPPRPGLTAGRPRPGGNRAGAQAGPWLRSRPASRTYADRTVAPGRRIRPQAIRTSQSGALACGAGGRYNAFPGSPSPPPPGRGAR
jgi:hypothetical protein